VRRTTQARSPRNGPVAAIVTPTMGAAVPAGVGEGSVRIGVGVGENVGDGLARDSGAGAVHAAAATNSVTARITR